MTDELEQARTQLQSAQKQLQLLTDAITHDLRAPLRSIESFAARVAESAASRLEERERDQLQRVLEAAARMTSLLAALGELSRATHAELHTAEVDLSLLAEWVLAELQDAQPDRQTQIGVQPGLFTQGDERLLKQMLTQLLHNAWKFSPAQSAVRIEISGETHDGRQTLTIRDHGVGFDNRYAHKLFEPLQRLHGPEQGGGHGLGLAIAQRIAQRHGGCITADSRPGDGAVFTVELPALEGSPR
ncbi:MAG TPA: ATP-binding protein [Lysobacter sp.]|jgi:signal transduction histidine kinase|nr:ATP-binding protein [Lysobacter sp.]